MRPYTRTILELFDSKRRFLIPHYQRQYAWRVTPQLELLWSDIELSANRLETSQAGTAPHFMGAIVISQMKTFGKQVQAFEVIDGQQRLTTFQLLLSALHEVAKQFSPTYAEELVGYLFNEGVMEAPEVERYKLWPSLVDRATFIRILDPANEATAAEHAFDDENDGGVRPAVDAKAFFVEAIRKRVCPDGAFDAFKMEKLFETLKDGVAVVSIELESGDDPQTIFETLNSRGVDLTAADLMRNFIFQRAVGMGQKNGSLVADTLYRSYWLPLDRWFWRTGETRGRLTRPRLDWMLADLLTEKIADLVSVEHLYDRYRSWITRAQPFAGVEPELQAISVAAAVYKEIITQEKSSLLGRFGLFAKAFDVSTATPLVLYLATEANLGGRLGEALGLIESYIVRRDICGLTTASYNRFFVEAISALRAAEADKIVTLNSYFQASTNDTAKWPTDEEWKHAWLSRAQYKPARQGRLRYIFDALEARKRENSEVVEIKTNLTLEHILPQKWREHWPIPGTSLQDDIDVEQLAQEMDRDAKVHLMGNLTLLTHTLNATVSNGPFSTKMAALKAQSALVLNRELHGYDKWDETTITDRGLKLFEVARGIWPRPAQIATPILPIEKESLIAVTA